MHVEKYNRSAMGHMLAHYDRTHPGSKSNIDTEKTHLNTNYAANDQPMPQIDFIHHRLTQIKVHNRKDVNIFCDWVITAPKTLSETSYEQFFSETYKFMTERYGKENVISAYVHMDETQPHMHFAFIPVIIDKKKNIPKLCAKEIITKKELKTIHRDMSDHMKKVFGKDIGILNGATELGNISVDVLRSNTAKIHEMQNDIMLNKDAELERKRNSISGKIFKRDTVEFTGEEMDKLRDVMNTSEAVSRNADEIIASANKVKEQAEEKCEKYEELLSETLSYKELLSDKEKELRKRSHDLYDKEELLIQRESMAENKKKYYEREIETIANREEESRKRVEKMEQEMRNTIEEPYGYYNKLLLEKDKEIAFINDFLDDSNNTKVFLGSRNAALHDTIYELESRLEETEHEKTAAAEQAVSETKIFYEKSLSEKDDIIREKEHIISEKDSIIGELKGIAESFKEKLEHAYLVVARVCMAVAKLAYIVGGKADEFSAHLTKKQEHLIAATCNYAAKEAEKENFDKYAYEILHSGGIGKDIQKELDILERDDPSYCRSSYDYSR